MRPSLRTSTSVAWRSSDRLHIGTGAASASLVGVNESDLRALITLDGSMSDELLTPRANLMATLLNLIGAIHDGPTPTPPAPSIRVEGAGLIAEAARGLLGAQDSASDDAAGVLLCAHDTSEPLRHRGDTLAGMTVRHLPVYVRARTIVVGPLFDPLLGTSCLRCQHLTRCDRDPSWPLVAAQLAMPLPRPVSTPTLGERTLAVVAAALAIEQLLAPPEAATSADGTLEWTDGLLRRRSWPRHPECPMHPAHLS